MRRFAGHVALALAILSLGVAIHLAALSPTLAQSGAGQRISPEEMLPRIKQHILESLFPTVDHWGAKAGILSKWSAEIQLSLLSDAGENRVTDRLLKGISRNIASATRTKVRRDGPGAGNFLVVMSDDREFKSDQLRELIEDGRFTGWNETERNEILRSLARLDLRCFLTYSVNTRHHIDFVSLFMSRFESGDGRKDFENRNLCVARATARGLGMLADAGTYPSVLSANSRRHSFTFFDFYALRILYSDLMPAGGRKDDIARTLHPRDFGKLVN